VAEGGGLLNRCRVKSPTGGSNPPLSAITTNKQGVNSTAGDFSNGLGIRKLHCAKYAQREAMCRERILKFVEPLSKMLRLFFIRGGKGKMNTIVTTYPGFEKLPRSVKQLLVASEACFLPDTKSLPAETYEVPKFLLWQLAVDFRRQWGRDIMAGTG
jgi:hypothetical protein